MDDVLTQHIMEKVALKERLRLLGILKFSIPVLILLTISLVATTQRTAVRLLEKKSFMLIVHLEYDANKLIPQLSEVGGSVVEEITDGVLALSLLSGLGVFMVAKKTKITSFPKRFAEIKKYLV